MLDIASVVPVHVDTLIAAQNDIGVCDAIERNAPAGKPAAMSAPNMPKVAGIDSTVPAPAHTAAPLDDLPAAPGALIQDRLAGWVSDLTTLHELTERLARTRSLDDALNELLDAGAALVGARRGLVVLEPADGLGPAMTLGLGLAHADLGHLETVPRRATSYGRLLDHSGGRAEPVAAPDLLADTGLDPRQREVAARLGYGASYAVPLAADTAGETPGAEKLGAAVWLYDEPAEPVERQRHLVGLYTHYAGEHLARLLELERARTRVAAIAEELLPSRLPRIPGIQLTARHRTGPRGGGDWYDALPLPDGALGLTVGSVSGSGPSAVGAIGRLRASLRAYAVMEGEDPVAVLSDLELLLRLTEPARTATALFAYAEPAKRKILLAGAGHAPPLVVGERRTEFIETSLSAPLGMLACWEAPSVEMWAAPGETVLFYTDGLPRRTGDPMDRAFARLHAAAASVPTAFRDDPGAVADHVLRTVLPDGAGTSGTEDFVLLAARFD
ncbi:PP2C family protein-serine/threonine phosphatase [Streptomyces sp. AK02-01A]|uniref:PP2C family protein-serine/threonine phosphatase n=1 Tax=Streptomyces sp. AK02-01A TaxID=3028648 RepID=UPI0029BBC8E6|nr:PP2C family protein-serine/threonine phosphatase [Streptomyces sp. AK02-01A]MDX3853006.1 PP2C family protein-serine/threonine phosphatase [Streptomyces sp. AK02-01A]